MKHARDFWPMAREFGFELDDDEIRCEPCDGTGTRGLDEAACECPLCRGLGAVERPSSIRFAEVVGHA